MSFAKSIIFGPVSSRRFGISLGVDLSLELKQCNFDCLYCELEKSKPSLKQKSSTSVTEIIQEIEKSLQKLKDENKKIDVLTFTANGEPTLYPYLEDLIKSVNNMKNKFDFETLILSNGSTIGESKMRKILLNFDQVKLSLDTANSKTFKKIDRPIDPLSLDEIKNGILEFSKQFDKKLFLETLFVKTLNDSIEEVEELNKFFLKVQKNSKNLMIHIGTIDRPPAYRVEKVSQKEMLDIFLKFNSKLPILLTSKENKKNYQLKKDFSTDEILNTLKKRPLTKNDILSLFSDESVFKLKELQKNGKINILKNGDEQFYTVKKSDKEQNNG